MKYCSKCNQNKAIDCFYKDAKKTDGLSHSCKECRKTYINDYNIKNKEKIKKDNKEWWINNKDIKNQQRKDSYPQNKEKINTDRKTLYKNNKRRFKGYDLKKIYGITIEDYDNLLLQQNSCCAICKQHKDVFTKALAVDHCHVSGKIRGLLCTNCNRAIGNLKDSIDNIKSALTYMENQNE